MFSRQTKTPSPSSGKRHVRGYSRNGSSGMAFPSPKPSLVYGLSRLHAENDDGIDTSSCDDAHVSRTSSRGRKVRDNSSIRGGSRGNNDGILKEISRVSNNSRSRLSSTFGSGSKKLERNGYADDCSSAGVLDILKDDINSLKLLRSKTMELSENVPYACLSPQPFKRGRVKSTSKSPMRGRMSDFPSSHTPRTRSVGKTFRDSNPSELTRDSWGSGNSWQNENRSKKKADAKNDEFLKKLKVLKRENEWESARKVKAESATNDELLKKLKILELENELLHDTVRKVKDHSSKIVAHNEEKLVKIVESNDKTLSEFSDVKFQLDRSKSKNAELERSLHEVTNTAERITAGMATSRAENDELLEKFRILEKENERLTDTVRTVEEDSMKMMKANKERLNEVSAVKMQLDKSRSKEAKLEWVLREVISNVESEWDTMSEELLASQAMNEELLKKSEVLEQGKKEDSKHLEDNEKKLREYSNVKMQLNKAKCKEADLEQALHEMVRKIEKLAEELSTAYKMHHCEKVLLEERLEGASKEIAEKTSIIHELESDMERFKRSQDHLEMSMQSNENCLLEKVRSLEMELEASRLACYKMGGKAKQISDKLSNAERLNHSFQESFDMTMKEKECPNRSPQGKFDITKTEKDEFTIPIKTPLREAAEKLGIAMSQKIPSWLGHSFCRSCQLQDSGISTGRSVVHSTTLHVHQNSKASTKQTKSVAPHV